MIGFFIKKSFFDSWDNLISLILLNLGFVAMLSAAYGILLSYQVSILLGILLSVTGIELFSVFVGSVSHFTKDFVFYQRPGFKDFGASIKKMWKPSLLLGGILFFLILLIGFVIPFYAGFGTIVGALVVAMLSWFAFFVLIASFYYFPLVAQLDNSGKKALKKCFILVFDNIGFSIFLFFYTLFNSVLSVVTAFLLPGFSSVLMTHQVALKLLMFKYDYLEENPEEDRKKIPWSALFIDEREKVGHRSLKGMIFPWKE